MSLIFRQNLTCFLNRTKETHSTMNHLIRQRPDLSVALAAAGLFLSQAPTPNDFRSNYVGCEKTASNVHSSRALHATPPSWIRKEVLARIGVPLPTPRVIKKGDPALKLPKRALDRRQKDEKRMLELLETAPSMKGDPEKLKKLGSEIFEVTYGKGVTPQLREDFLIRYGCTGWTDEIVKTLVELCESRGIVEIGAGHGQWARALSDAYDSLNQDGDRKKSKRFDFVLAYDDNSNLPLNTHIYNPYTQPHHDYFGNVKKIESKTDTRKILQSWACRGRALLLVYPPPGEMAFSIVNKYVDAAEENDTVIYVGEGRGGANGDDSMFDFFESGEWVLQKVMKVQSPPGDKGYEMLYILQRKKPVPLSLGLRQ